MSRGGPGRPRRKYAVRRVRLVNFHNLVDETVEIRGGGHLFLLGDNGSGKTTVLDALHMIFSGGSDVELNAAARIGGRAGEGRTYAGIVLRLDPERGLLNEGGAITYALAELVDDEGHALTIGVGLEATTLEAHVTRWGVVHAGPLDEVPITTADPDGRTCATPRDALREALPKHEVHPRMTDYRRAIADRLFGGPATFDDVCRFWSMAKAYREIVTQARDFDALFARLLPAPDTEVFQEILRSLRAIDELEATLADIEAQRSYVASLEARCADVARHREEIARYTWLATAERLSTARAALADSERSRDDSARAAAEAALAAASLEAELATVVTALRDAESSEGAELGRAIVRAEEDLAVRAADAGQRSAEAEREGERMGALEREIGEACAALAAELRGRAGALEASMARAGGSSARIDGCRDEIAAARATAGAVERGAVPAELAPIARRAEDEVRAACAEAREAREVTRVERARVEGRVAEARAGVARIEAEREPAPDVPGCAEGRAALARAGIAARAVYELVEPRRGASPHEVAAIEAMVGPEVLATFVVAANDAGRARATLAAEAPGARVVVRTALDVAVPAWVGETVQAAPGVAHATALSALAAAMSQPASLGEPARPDATGVVELRGVAFRPAESEPRWLGAEARRRAWERRLAEARRTLEAAESAAEQARTAESLAERHAERCADVERTLVALRGPEIHRAHARAVALGERARDQRQRLSAAEARLVDAAARESAAREVLSALRARAGAVGLDEVERRLSAMRARKRDLEAGLGAAQRRAGALETEGVALGARVDAARSDVRRLEESLDADAAVLRRHLETPHDDEALERYVRVTQRGSQFKTIEAIEARLDDARRAEMGAILEIEGDGARGVRSLAWAGRFGFAYDAVANRVEDRRGQPLRNVLSKIDQELADQRTVINEKTRELMDTLVMGALARRLQDQVEGLRRVVREINALLEDLEFGTTRYRFRVTPKPDRREIEELVRRVSLADEEARRSFRDWIDARMRELDLSGADGVPELLDYRRWYDYRLVMRTRRDGQDVELTREKRQLGSGGEQGVPNYLLVLALAKLMFDDAGARVRPLLFDEAFYGIDAGRRDQLLRFATELGLQLAVASPDQDGATPAVRHATTLFLVKDENADVHLAPYHYWNHARDAQRGLFDAEPDEAPPETAECALGARSSATEHDETAPRPAR